MGFMPPCGSLVKVLGSTSGTTERGAKKTPWTSAEDEILMEYVSKHGEGNWASIQKISGLDKSGKSCRNRWANYLRPHLKKGAFSAEEEEIIIELHGKHGNKWAHIAAQLPGRTDNEVKNFWNIRLKKSQRVGLEIHRQQMSQTNQLLSSSPSNKSLSSPTLVTLPSVKQILPNSFLPVLPVQENYLNFGFDPHPNKVVLALPSMKSPEMVTSTLKPFSSDHVIAIPNNAARDFEVMESEFMHGTGAKASGSGINFMDDELSMLLDNFPLVVPLPEWDDLHPRLCSDSSCKY
ncbi:transcription factor MYB86-like isoform X2 [Primulina huaijiensis]|uniref:transcription factor MYB86-like isoform X2 n=1 Tax=Primulina huaijiensis TaxID=1492673 RepID=UPI003CC6F973